MLSETRPRETMNVRIFCLGLVFGLTTFANAGEIPKPDCSLCGYIKDAQTDQPVTDAIVRISSIPIPEAQTDANGFYCFEKIRRDGDYRISIDSNEYIGIYDYQAMPSVNLSKNKQVVKDFKLDRACMIEVLVVDEANQPVEGAELSVRPFDDELAMRMTVWPRRYIRTDKNGTTVLGGLTPSKMGYLIIASHSTDTESLREDGTKTRTSQPDYAPGTLIVIPNSTEYIESGRIVLQKGIDVAGYAQYEDGVPASELTITAYRYNFYGRTGQPYFQIIGHVNTNGNFTLRHIITGSYHIYAKIPVEKGNSKSVAELYTTLPLPDNTPLAINIPKQSTQPLVSIEGNMIFTGNSIPDNVNISVASMDGKNNSSSQWQKSVKDACDTNFVIEQLLPGKYKLTFSSFYIKEKTVENIDAPSEGLEVELISFDRFALKGTVLISLTGMPIQSFKAHTKQIQSFLGAQNYQPSSQWKDINNMEGNFNIEAIGPGIYQVQVAAEDFAWAWSEDINTDRNNPFTIKLSAGGGIKGRVVDEQGNLIDGAKVLPLSKAGGVRPEMMMFGKNPFISEEVAVETVDGAFELNQLAAGVESLKVIHPDYADSILNDIEIKEGRTTDGIEVVLKKGGTVEGYVYDYTGQPQSDITLIFQNMTGYRNPLEEKAGRLATVKTDDSGYYRVEGLPEKPCFVQRQGGHSGLGVVCRAFVPAGGKVTRYDFGGRPVVKGRVVFDGNPLVNYKLDLTTTQRPHSSVFLCSTKTGPEGEFMFGGVPKGTWSIYCDDPENKSKLLKMATIDTTGDDMDTGVIPNRFSTIAVSIEYEQDTSNWDVTDVYLQYENIFWGQPVVIFEKPASYNEPFIARNIMPGRYRLVVNRGYVTQQRTVDITEGNMNITVLIPKGNASVRGRLIRCNDWQILWREGKEVVCYIKADANNSYEFNNLPAGKYHLSPDGFTNSNTLLEFDLTEGKQKVLDIDVTNYQKKLTSVIQVYVLDEYGIPVTGADIWLERNKNTIEPILTSTPAFHFQAEPGTYTLTGKIDGYKEIKQPVTIKIWDYQVMKRPPDPVLVWLEK